MFGRKEKHEVLTYRTPAGAKVRIPFRRCLVPKTIEYFVSSAWCETIGELIDVAVGACPALCDRGLLDPADLGRLCALLQDLRGFKFATPDSGERPAADLKAQWMRRATKAWVKSLFRGGDKLMPLFATEAAYFLEAIAHGARCEYPEEKRWHLGGRLDAAPRHDDAIHEDRKWKKGFTEMLVGITLLARTQEALDLLLAGGRRTLPVGATFKFVVWRCPLSGGVGDRPAFLYSRPELPRETWPYGAMVLDEDDNPAGRDIPDSTHRRHIEGVIPWRWIVEYVDRRQAAPDWKPIPQFPWEITSESRR